MAISVTGQDVPRRYDLFAKETLAQSTATTPQTLATTSDLTVISGGTATGVGRNLFTLADGTEGQEKEVLFSGTGEAKVLPLSGTATGWHVMTEDDDYLSFRFLDSKWRVRESSATVASST